MTAGALKSAYNALLSKGRLSADPGQAALVARLSDLQTSLANSTQHAPNGLYIYGGVGTGKSRVADLFAATLPPAVSRRRAHFHEFMLDIHSRLHRAWSAPGYAGDPLANIGREVRDESRVVCFDEFQVTDIADAMILQRLFSAIWAAGGVMVATSNRHPDTLYENGLNRPLILPFLAQLQQKCDLWKMAGETDYRRSSASGPRVQTLFTDRPAFLAALDRACHGAEPPQPRRLTVMMGRHLYVRAAQLPPPPPSPSPAPPSAAGRLVVHASFAELCEASLGAADYHALCHASSALFLDGLRPLARNELDYARRLITLIDLAYESRTRVYCYSKDATSATGVFAEIVRAEQERLGLAAPRLQTMDVKRGGGSSSSMMSTFVGDTEWSATGLSASLATGGAGETDVVFAVGRAVSRLHEMGSRAYGSKD